MRLGQVIANAAQLVRGSPETEISSIAYDSRKASPGSLFCALGGIKSDGSQFIAEAISRGAVAALSAKDLPGNYALAISDNPRRAMALAAANFYGFPAAKLTMLGVTGTNGKTTVAYLLYQMARAAGRRAGLIGTVEQRFGEVARPATHTTPESVDLQALLAEMADARTEIVAMEVSSHALSQSRVGGIRYAAAAFTNLTRDHLDYHHTMDDYFEAKSKLFHSHLAQQGTAVVGVEDEWSNRLAASLSGRTVWRYGIESGDITVRNLSMSLDGFTADFITPLGTRPVKSPLVGRHNVLNALCATGLSLAAGIPLDAVADALATSNGAPGRLERVPDPAGRRVFVDYAHTDDALARALDSLRALSPTGSRLVVVFGCGGDRDRGKRPLMGKAAAERADVVVVTSDNPRTEDPDAIIREIVVGIPEKKSHIVADRAEAIRIALKSAHPGDSILIAGKGHEDYQIVGTTKRPFDDRVVAREALRELSQ